MNGKQQARAIRKQVKKMRKVLKKYQKTLDKVSKNMVKYMCKEQEVNKNGIDRTRA